MGASPSASVSIRPGASALSSASTVRLRPMPRMRVAPMASACKVAPAPSVPVTPLMASHVPAPTPLRRNAANDVPR